MSGQNAGSIYYNIDVETAQVLRGGQAVNDVFDKMQRTFDKTDKTAKGLNTQLTKTAEGVKKAAQEVDGANKSIGLLNKLLGGMLGLQGAKYLITLAEGYGEMADRIQMATSSAEEYQEVQARLLDTANQTYRPLKEAQELYIRTADSLRSMGYSTAGVLDITDSFSYALVKNATSADRAGSALDAYSKAIQKGKLEADGWETIISAIPTVINDLATSMGKSTAEVRALGAAGKLTASDLNEGLRASLDANKAAAAGMATTVKDSINTLVNSLTVYLGEANRTSNATGLISGAIITLAQNLDTVTKALLALGAGALARYVAAQTAALAATVRATAASRAQAIEELRSAQAQAASTAATLAHAQATAGLTTSMTQATAAATAHQASMTRLAAAQAGVATVGRTILGVLGGPLGLIGLLTTAAAGMLLLRDNTEKAKPPVDLLTGSIDGLTAAQLRLQQVNTADKILELEQAAKAASNRLQSLQRDMKLTQSGNVPGLGSVTGAYAGREEAQAKINRSLVEEEANLDDVNSQLATYKKRQDEISDAIKKRNAPKDAAFKPSTTSQDGQKALDALRDQAALAKLSGEERAKLAAVQKLGADATAEERAEAERLAVQIYQLTEAQGAQKKSTSEATQAAKENAKEIEKLRGKLAEVGLTGEQLAAVQAKNQLNQYATPEQIAELQKLNYELAKKEGLVQNVELLKGMQQELELASKKGLELAQAQAALKLNKYATPEQIKEVKDLTAALYAQQQAQQNKQLLGQVDPLAGATQNFETEIANLQKLNDAKLLSDQRYLELKEQAEVAYHDRMTALEEERFRSQSVANDLLIGSINKFGEASTNAITGLLSGTYDAQDGIRVLAQGILQEGVSALVQLGLQQVKNLVIGQAAGAAATAQGVAQAATLATAYTPAAAAASVATFGGAATAGLAALSTVATSALSLFGGKGRQYGGPVDASSLYRVNENGAPEVFNAANGQQFMIPNQKGQVVSNKDATGANGQGGGAVYVNLYNDPGKAGTVNETRAEDGSRSIDIFVADLMGDGKSAKALQQAYGLKRQGQ